MPPEPAPAVGSSGDGYPDGGREEQPPSPELTVVHKNPKPHFSYSPDPPRKLILDLMA